VISIYINNRIAHTAKTAQASTNADELIQLQNKVAKYEEN
jgi:hypothetical protein